MANLILKNCFNIVLLLIWFNSGFAQINLDVSNSKEDSIKKVNTAAIKARYYNLPNNQLMYWPAYYLTAAQIEERARQEKIANKPSTILANTIIKTVFSKKKNVAEIPKF